MPWTFVATIFQLENLNERQNEFYPTVSWFSLYHSFRNWIKNKILNLICGSRVLTSTLGTALNPSKQLKIINQKSFKKKNLQNFYNNNKKTFVNKQFKPVLRSHQKLNKSL